MFFSGAHWLIVCWASATLHITHQTNCHVFPFPKETNFLNRTKFPSLLPSIYSLLSFPSSIFSTFCSHFHSPLHHYFCCHLQGLRGLVNHERSLWRWGGRPWSPPVAPAAQQVLWWCGASRAGCEAPWGNERYWREWPRSPGRATGRLAVLSSWCGGWVTFSLGHCAKCFFIWCQSSFLSLKSSLHSSHSRDSTSFLMSSSHLKSFIYILYHCLSGHHENHLDHPGGCHRSSSNLEP